MAPAVIAMMGMRVAASSCLRIAAVACHQDTAFLHGPYRSWTRKVTGKTVTRRLSDDQLKRYRSWFDNDKRLRALITELEELSIDAINQAEGWNNKS